MFIMEKGRKNAKKEKKMKRKRNRVCVFVLKKLGSKKCVCVFIKKNLGSKKWERIEDRKKQVKCVLSTNTKTQKHKNTKKHTNANANTTTTSHNAADSSQQEATARRLGAYRAHHGRARLQDA